MSDNDPLDEACVNVTQAIQEYLNALSADRGDPPEVLQVAVVCYETVLVTEDGSVARRTDYVIPTDSFSASTAVGVCEVAKETLLRNVTKSRCDHERD